jgi:ankyrin repeat protein
MGGVMGGVEVNRRWCALHDAAYLGFEEIVRLLLDWGANIDARSPSGKSALYFAVSRSKTSVVELLVQRSVDLTWTDRRTQQTALHLAVTTGNVSIVLLLLRANIDFSVTDKWHRTALALARLRGKDKVVQVLEQHVQQNRSNQRKRIDAARSSLSVTTATAPTTTVSSARSLLSSSLTETTSLRAAIQTTEL